MSEISRKVSSLNKIRSFLSDNRKKVSWDDVEEIRCAAERIKDEINLIKHGLNKEMNDKKDKFYQDNVVFFDGMKRCGFEVTIGDAYMGVSGMNRDIEFYFMDREPGITCYFDNSHTADMSDGKVPWKEIVEYYRNEVVLHKEAIEEVTHVYKSVESVLKETYSRE